MVEASTQAFRQSFKVSKELLKWYPGHMEKGMAKMQAILRSIDCVVEVHDARVAISGRNPTFVNKLLGVKPHILVLNKKDLIPESDIKRIAAKLKNDGIKNLIFTDCLNHHSCNGLKKLVPTAINLISKAERYNRCLATDLQMMIIGIPNVGKSTIINILRNRNLERKKATSVGPMAGVTRSVLNKIKIHTNPTMYLIDTPGILPPNIDDVEVGLKLALCSCLKDSNVTPLVIADFMLYWLNKIGNFQYVNELGLDGPIDKIHDVLMKIAVDYKYLVKTKDVRSNSIVINPHFNQAASLMIEKFRKGRMGLINLDSEYLQ